MNKTNLLNSVVVIVGAVIVFLGLNVGLGGIKTLGWQSTRDFVSITDAATFHAQDSHIRFIGGVWFGVGAAFMIGGFAMRMFRSTLIILSAMVAIAGLFRLNGMDTEVIFSAAIAPSLAFELVGFPLLALWLMASGKRDTKVIKDEKS
ncbi:DUF4345 domain-containing protein [Sedimentitalea sp. CY04]|uniref:DUF4345 domain-containing protein n=1 Tax=Parasedimentitalea denitrificans TaxID=2211118 RepID=A0ABX0W624_9RHOB|nr:DUF4345 domain-containing protein [Sedimentitalea sp. CY04]NIZ61103.1 DUF4345 domain-containing protein [Sedimentitalea sp. CY04]